MIDNRFVKIVKMGYDILLWKWGWTWLILPIFTKIYPCISHDYPNDRYSPINVGKTIDIPNSHWLVDENRGVWRRFTPLTTGLFDGRWYTKLAQTYVYQQDIIAMPCSLNVLGGWSSTNPTKYVGVNGKDKPGTMGVFWPTLFFQWVLTINDINNAWG